MAANEQPEANQNMRWVPPRPYRVPVMAGGVLLIGLGFALFILYESNPITDSQQVNASLPPERQPGTDGRTTGSDTEIRMGSTEDPGGRTEDERGYPFSVHRSDRDRYVFQFEDQVAEVDRGSSVRLTLYWQDVFLEPYEKHIHIAPDGRVSVEWSPGNDREQIPPGVYRIRLSSGDILRYPLLLQRFTEYLSEASDQRAFTQLNESQALEYAVSVGTRQDVRRFHRHMLCELKRRGRAMISAWEHWLRMARDSYDGKREEKQVAQDLFDRFMNVRNAVSKVRSWIEQKEAKFTILPYANLRGELLKLSYVLSKKVNAMSMTVLRQVGISPMSWPAAFVQRGFDSNINVLRHMSQYDRETIQDVEHAIDKASLRLPYFDRMTYGLHRFQKTVQFLEQVQRLTYRPYRQILDLSLTGAGESKQIRLRALHQYVHDVIQTRKEGVSDIVSDIKRDQVRHSFQKALDLLPEYATVVLKQMAKAFDLSPSEIMNRTMESGATMEGVRGQIAEQIDRISSSARVQVSPGDDCE